MLTAQLDAATRTEKITLRNGRTTLQKMLGHLTELNASEKEMDRHRPPEPDRFLEEILQRKKARTARRLEKAGLPSDFFTKS